MSRYDSNAANTNRVVRFRVQPTNAADANALMFGMLKGRAPSYPHYGHLIGTSTPNQELSQIRTNLVRLAVSNYVKPVGLQLADDSFATGGLTAINGPALIITFEVDEQGEFFNNAWAGNTTLAKHLTTNITDTLGIGGMSAPKTKPGLQSLLDSIYSVSYDGGVTGPFGNLTATAAITIPGGLVTAGAPKLNNNGGGITAGTSGLTITLLS